MTNRVPLAPFEYETLKTHAQTEFFVKSKTVKSITLKKSSMPSSETESNGSKDLQNHKAKSLAKSHLSYFKEPVALVEGLAGRETAKKSLILVFALSALVSRI